MAACIDYKENELHVQLNPGSDRVEINYRDNGKLHVMERYERYCYPMRDVLNSNQKYWLWLFFCCRDAADPLEKTLIRIGRNFQKKDKKKKEKGHHGKKSSAAEQVLLSRAGGCLAYDITQLTNAQWETGMSVFIDEHLSLTGLYDRFMVFTPQFAPLLTPLFHAFSCPQRAYHYLRSCISEKVHPSSEFPCSYCLRRIQHWYSLRLVCQIRRYVVLFDGFLRLDCFPFLRDNSLICC
jgi:hypothetical protein